MRSSYFLAASLLMSAAPAFAQEKAAADRKPGEVEITFANGSTVRLVIETPALAEIRSRNRRDRWHAFAASSQRQDTDKPHRESMEQIGE